MMLTIEDQQRALSIIGIPWTRYVDESEDVLEQHWDEVADRTGPADETEMQAALDGAATSEPVPLEDQIAALEATVTELKARLDSVGGLEPVDNEVRELRDALVNGAQP